MHGGKVLNMEIYTNGTESSIVEINSNSFMSAFELADKTKNRLRIRTPEWMNFAYENRIDYPFINDFNRKKVPNAKITIINKGLMTGFYTYSFTTKEAFYYFNNPKNLKIKPLKKYSLNNSMPEYDFVISYSGKDINKVRDVFNLLKKSFKIYFLDIDKVNEDPLWQIRFREAMYHSHYFLPVFSENYLTTEGALSEFFESLYLNVDFRTITFYNYFIPFILGELSYEKIKSHIEVNKNSYAQYFNYDTKLFFEILNDINYGIKIKNYPFKDIVLFLKSILINSKNNLAYLINNKNDYEGNILKDFNFLKFLLKETEYIIYSNLSEGEFSGKKLYALKIVTLFIKKSHKKWNLIDLLSDGRCINRQFTSEIQENAIPIETITEPYKHIRSFLETI